MLSYKNPNKEEKMLDQFFTNKDIAESCMMTIDQELYDVVIEPSAGAGSFFNLITQDKIGIDLDPKISGLIKHDYLTWNPQIDSSKRILVLGNPPFGKNASLAVKFFNHSSYADTIAFIIPKTFKKPSLINKLNDDFNLDIEIDLPAYSFHTPDGELYDVPCVWQVWNKGPKRAKISTETTHKDFQFVDKSDASFLVQRVGVNAGAVHKDFNRSSNSHYCIKANDNVYNIMKKIEWDDNSAKYNTAGNPSISKNDLIKTYKNLTDIGSVL